MNHEKLCQEFQDFKCLLLTTKNELHEQMRQRSIPLQHTRVRILAACGHEHECVVTNYLRRRTAVMCKECRLKNIQSINKNRTLNCYEIEFMGFLKIREILEKNNFEVKKTKEGCRADFMIRPNDSKKDEWIGVQLKVCSKISYKMYSFRNVNKTYDNLLMFCYCLEECKLWIFPYSEIKELKHKLNISVVSKYNKFIINQNDNIQSIIKSFQDNFQMYTEQELLIPVSNQQQQEQIYALKREKHLPFIQFTYPEIENGKTDFYICNLKIQEKVCSIRKARDIIELSVNNGRINGKRLFRSYCLHDNDFYWCHVKNSDDFFVIPEFELYSRGYISDSDTFIKNVKVILKTS